MCKIKHNNDVAVQSNADHPQSLHTLFCSWEWECDLNPFKPNFSNCYTMPCRPNLPFRFLTFGHSGAERQSAQMSEIENGRLGLHGTEHSKCNHLMTLGFKGLTRRFRYMNLSMTF